MAKRYIRINFQNAPSTATPLSAEILNKMDKGIDDIDNAVEFKIDKSSIVHTTEVNDATKVPSSTVTYGLQQSVDTLNNNLAFEPWENATLLEGWTGWIKYAKNGLGQVRLAMSLGTGSKVIDGTIIAIMPYAYRTSNAVTIPVFKSNIPPYDTVLGMYIDGNGYITIRQPLTSSIPPNMPDASLSANIVYYLD